jgi:NAD/NADP transhydrogenase alpha subunit
MPEADRYFGIKEENRLVSTAGVHVYAARYKVAALGIIATLPLTQKKGYGTRVTQSYANPFWKKESVSA